MKFPLTLVSFFSNLFHIHHWYPGTYSLGVLSKHTGDHIGRSERRCVNCECKELSIAQLSAKNKKEVENILGKHKYYIYKDGDWLDTFTRSVLIGPDADYLNKPYHGKNT